MAYKKLTVEQWEKLIERFERSGMEQRAFAAKAGVSFSRLKYWLYKIRREQAEGRRRRGVLLLSDQTTQFAVVECSMMLNSAIYGERIK